VVLAVGRVERLKSPELLVDAIAILRQRGIAATATFAGRSSGERDGVPYRQWLLDYAKRVNVPIEIVEESPRHQLVEIYSRCRAVCIASAYESFSIAAMEGMAAGRATVVHPRVGAAEIYTGAARSQVCERSPQGIADALAPLLEDEDLAVRLGAADRESVSAVCDAEVVAQAREAALAEVLIRRNRRRRRRRGRNR
jgi:glycosyltransferase involved in cell wall biosynthesis